MNLELLNKKIEELEVEVKHFENSFESWHKEIEEEGYAIAGEFFGHSDDCFEKGTEYGVGLKSVDILAFLIRLRDDETMRS